MDDPTRARDPRTESIFRYVRAGTPATRSPDPGEFLVGYWPHLFAADRGIRPDVCAWCVFPRVHPVHPEEV